MNRIVLVLAAIGMVACNGEEGGDATTQGSRSNSRTSCTPRSYEEMTEYGWGCKETLPRSTSPGPSIGNGDAGDTAGRSTSGGSRSANIAQYAEYEPNNTMDNANPLAFPVVSDDVVPGVKVTGSVQDSSDASDYFVITPNQRGSYLVYLCAETCTEQPTDSKVSLSVIDHSGLVIAENPLFEESTKFLRTELDAGLPYYIQVLGFDTGEQAYPYELVIID